MRAATVTQAKIAEFICLHGCVDAGVSDKMGKILTHLLSGRKWERAQSPYFSRAVSKITDAILVDQHANQQDSRTFYKLGTRRLATFMSDFSKCDLNNKGNSKVQY